MLCSSAIMKRWTLFQDDWQAVLASIPDASIDAIITDPPYGTTNIDWDTAPDLPSLWRAFERVIKPSGNMLLFCAQPFTTDLINSNRAHFRYETIWHKTRAVGWLDANKRPLRAHENILLFCQRYRGAKNAQLATYHPQKTAGTPYTARQQRGTSPHYNAKTTRTPTTNTGDRHPTSVQTVAHDPISLHPTQKPLALMRYLVRSYTDPDDLVLDPFCGSGSTGEACLIEGRRFLGGERAADHYATAHARLTAATARALHA